LALLGICQRTIHLIRKPSSVHFKRLRQHPAKRKHFHRAFPDRLTVKNFIHRHRLDVFSVGLPLGIQQSHKAENSTTRFLPLTNLLSYAQNAEGLFMQFLWGWHIRGRA
jgi:hypothetical protein